MELQLDLIPFHYYNTLGFDVELIDYIDHVDDLIVLEKVKPLYKDGGRPPVDPRTYFRMHYLYFTMPEITSFRQLCDQLINPKNQAWRNFIVLMFKKAIYVQGGSMPFFRHNISEYSVNYTTSK
ncbi:hypothetical protein [Aquibacillus salsiterrae]|uniref:Transposase InsH N-terminal domain-containing protein n=1 Tax=Aquibacillus salsiterrae TaxID=2950439 RepID=A0A9X4AG77_9BACI|nr:hypothetical protein [Aquibacillus salsiterrae]MDC3418661.1 hypothetical protein [Aquibacillus salsiterrae]